MAKQGIPGLVLVPLSDREIAQRRIVRWTFILLAIIFGISAMNSWLLPPDNAVDCESGLDADISPDSGEACNQAKTGQLVADRDSFEQDIIAVATSPETAQTEPVQTEPVQAEPVPAKPVTASIEPAPAKPVPTKTAPTKPVQAEPVPAKPVTASTEQAPAKPAPTKTAPTEPVQAEPVPAKQVTASTEQAPAKPAPAKPAPAKAAPAKAASAELAPAKQAPAKTAPTEPQVRTLTPPPQLSQPTRELETIPAPQATAQQRTVESSVRTVAPTRKDNAPTTQEIKQVLTKPPDAHLAEQGDAFAQYRLGKFYAKHSGPKAPESVSWYMKASRGLRRLAEKGNGEAMYVLGVMYAFGRGVKMDTEEARRWLTRAVEHKVAAARPVLARLVEKHGPTEGNRTDNGG